MKKTNNSRSVSMYGSIIVPAMIVIVLQVLWICGLLWSGGTMKTLNQNALNILVKNTESAGSALRNQMIFRWANVGSLSEDIDEIIKGYINEQGITIDEFIADEKHTAAVENELADIMLHTLRPSDATGIYVVFTNNNEDNIAPSDVLTLDGIHFRDLDPRDAPSDYSDIKLVHGKPGILTAHGIKADTLWEEHYSLDTSNPEGDYRLYLRPLLAARDAITTGRAISPEDFAYFSCHGVGGKTYLTYSIPLVVDNTVIGVIGNEIDAALVEERFLPASDFENIGNGGYILTEFTEDDTGIYVNPKIYTGEETAAIFAASPSQTFLRDIFTHDHMVSDSVLVYNREKAESLDTYHMSIYELDLYDSSSPFYDEKWAVIGAAPDHALFANTTALEQGLIVSSITCILFGLALTGVVVAAVVKPLKNLTEHLQDNSGKHSASFSPIPATRFDVREVAILRDVLNSLRERQIADGQRIDAERERYKLALSLAAGTVMEYDPAADIATISIFDTENISEPSVNTIERILIRTRHGEITHPEDTDKLIDLFSGHNDRPVVIRIKKTVLDHDRDLSSGEYVWIRFSCKALREADGSYVKLLGTTQNITAEELRKQLATLNLRIDPTTRLYNKEYGKILFGTAFAANARAGKPSLMAMIQIEPAITCETYYGLFFTNIIHAFIAEQMKEIIGKDDLLVRAGDNEILYFRTSDERDEEVLQALCDIRKDVYTGENKDIVLSITVGAAVSDPNDAGMDLFELTGRSFASLKYAVAHNLGGHLYFKDLPPEARKVTTFIPTPITFSADVTAMSITTIAFNLFEKTADTASVINLLARVIAYRFKLARFFVAENDISFLTSNVEYFFAHDPADEVKHILTRIPEHYYAQVDSLVKETGYCIFTSKEPLPDGVITLLRLDNVPSYSVLACGMFVGGELAGKIVFMHHDPDYVWTDETLEDLRAVAKLIASHLSRAKSDTASKAKTEFLSKISHEIRTPMNAILGLTQIASKSYDDDNTARVRDSLQKIDSSARFLLTIINDVLDMSKIESGQATIEKKPFDLSAAVNSVANMMRPLAENKGMDFITEFDIENRYVSGDEARLKQVLTNLCGNAIKFTDAGYISFTVKTQDGVDVGAGNPDTKGSEQTADIGSAATGTEQTADNGSGATAATDNGSAAAGTAAGTAAVTFIVTDTGIGISEEDADRIFGSYVQLSSSDKVYGGTGLGLSISAQIVKLMGGKIEVSSVLGKGSTFSFTIPLERGKAPEEKPEVFDYTDYFTGRRVLLVEDNELNVEIAVVLLEDAGFEVVTAENGQIGADEYDSRPDGYFDAILMDIRMPVLDGLGATRLIRTNTKHPDARTVPIIAMTANAFDEDMKKSLEAGMSGYLPKPIDTAKLYSLLDEVIGRDK